MAAPLCAPPTLAASAPAPAAPGCSPPTLAAASARTPARLPRASLAAARYTNLAPARNQRHLLPPRRRPACFKGATWPPAWKEPFAPPRKGCESACPDRAEDGRAPIRRQRAPSAQDSPSPLLVLCYRTTLPGATKRQRALRLPPPAPRHAGVQCKGLGAPRSRGRVSPVALRGGQLQWLLACARRMGWGRLQRREQGAQPAES